MQHGARPTKIDYRDYDYHKTFGAVKAIPFPAEYNTDAGLTMPNQEIANDYFIPTAPALPFGCTDYTTTELNGDLKGGNYYSPMRIENITHANANGGADVRQSLLAGKSLGYFTGIFNVRAIGQDYFDAIQTAMASGGTEKRSVSIGTPWYSIFEQVGANGILQAPKSFNIAGLPWHNWKICGWKTINGEVYLVGKSWQGPNYGDKGMVYFNRALINSLMAIPGTVAFTATTGALPPISTVTLSWLQFIISYARSFFPY